MVRRDAFAAEASVQLNDDGRSASLAPLRTSAPALTRNLAQLASHKTGVPLDKSKSCSVIRRFRKVQFPAVRWRPRPSMPAVVAAADNAIASLLNVATTTAGSPFQNRKSGRSRPRRREVFVKADGPDNGVPFADVLRPRQSSPGHGQWQDEATFGNPKPKFSTHSFGCHFVEVTWQPEIARLRVSRVVTVIDAGRILNPLAGRNQIEGAVVMGIGMALFEHTPYDPQNGAPINSNLADYVMAVNADAPPIEVHFLDFPDKEINELGARGIGEIGLAGIAAAITAPSTMQPAFVCGNCRWRSKICWREAFRFSRRIEV